MKEKVRKEKPVIFSGRKKPTADYLPLVESGKKQLVLNYLCILSFKVRKHLLHLPRRIPSGLATWWAILCWAILSLSVIMIAHLHYYVLYVLFLFSWGWGEKDTRLTFIFLTIQKLIQLEFESSSYQRRAEVLRSSVLPFTCL